MRIGKICYILQTFQIFTSLLLVHLLCKQCNYCNFEILKMSSLLGEKRKVIHSQAREIVFNVYNYFRTMDSDKTLKDLKAIVAEATKVSPRTVATIIKEGEAPIQEGTPKFRSPGKQRARKTSVTGLEDFEKHDFRNIV